MAAGDPTLREHFEALLRAERELREAERQNFAERMDAARREIDRRFETVESQDDRIGKIETFIANLTGRGIAIGVLGAVFVAVTASAITRLLLGV